jgi:CHAT domain-containing protein
MLSTLLLEPFADVLRANERVFVTASGALNSLPFHVLPFDGRPLGETHVLSLLPAASLLARSRADQPLARGDVTIVGDPAFDPELRPALPRLPGAAVEARAVARLYEVEEPLVGETATEPALRPLLCGRAMLHIAAHGHLDDIAPNTSSIVLAGPDELTVSDLIGLHVTADLAVLSACDTGRGTTTLGGDLVGLARGLFAAGVRRCIVSLWPVDDVAACVTMLAFHKVLRSAGGVAPAHALAAAQREVRGLSNAELADRYHSLGGTLTVERRSIRRAPPPSLPDYADADTDDDADDESLSSQRASIWAPFVLIGA